MDEKLKLLGNFENFDENSIEKLTFYLIFILENFLLKIEPSEITPFFYNNFFRFGGIFPLSLPGYALACKEGMRLMGMSNILNYRGHCVIHQRFLPDSFSFQRAIH